MLPPEVLAELRPYKPMPPTTYDDFGFFEAARRAWGQDYGPHLIELNRMVEKATGEQLILYLQHALGRKEVTSG